MVIKDYHTWAVAQHLLHSEHIQCIYLLFVVCFARKVSKWWFSCADFNVLVLVSSANSQTNKKSTRERIYAGNGDLVSINKQTTAQFAQICFSDQRNPIRNSNSRANCSLVVIPEQFSAAAGELTIQPRRPFAAKICTKILNILLTITLMMVTRCCGDLTLKFHNTPCIRMMGIDSIYSIYIDYIYV